MQRSSESIGTIAGALAKAQAELTNPEKSLVATIRSPFPRENDRTFRYAPLSSGLDIVRKSLGRHEIATFQTTAIDQDTGLVRLTTVLAHSSGEWVSSEWPVCPITDTASPQRMGAALTYARRYALFTLVGIAGEDDLDAPDLTHGTSPATASNGQSGPSQDAGSLPSQSNGSARKPSIRPAKPILAPDASAVVRAQLMAELEGISAPEGAIAWAHLRLPTKNTLLADDARIIEDTFQAKMTALEMDQQDGTNAAAIASDNAGDRILKMAEQTSPDLSLQGPELPTIERTVPLKPRRLRNKQHREFVATQACVVCGRKPSDAHHLRFAQPRALGRKVSDEFTVPLCREHHRELHHRGDEPRWWKDAGVDAIAIARGLWLQTQSDGWASSSPSRDPART
jgi:hypothetical protein